MHSFCKRAAVLALALAATPALAQFVPTAPPAGQAPPVPTVTTSVPTAGFVPPQPVPFPGFFPGYSSYYDPQGGYFRGVGDLVSSYGQYYQNVNQARLTNQSVEQEKIRTRRMLIEQHRYEQSLIPTANDVREKNRQTDLRRAMNDPPLPEILSGDALNVILRNIQSAQQAGAYGPTVPLDEDQLRRIQVTGGGGGSIAVFREGKLRWPFALRDTPFDEPRTKVTDLMNQAMKEASTDELRPATVRGLTQAISSLDSAIEKNAADMELSQIIEARRYLSELRDGARVLQNPNVGNYLSKKWSAQGRDVRELVQNMTSQGLRFAPSVRGDEAAYQSLYQALATYNYAFAQARR